MLRDYLPVLLQVIVAIGFAASALVFSVIIGKTGKRTAAKDLPYECGMIPQGEAQPRFSVKFYLVAMLFILFDLEIVFMYPWAVVYREMIVHDKVVLWSMLSFISILMVGYIYALKKGAFDWHK
ncbi:MAG: NADH-quinone oxidoreductase subunit [Verrucomicrobiota bacterium]|jgi:NADH-quinone oxidoreductase subunit A